MRLDLLGHGMRDDRRLISFYEASLVEAERLNRRHGRLELARTRELLSRWLPSPPARVLDIGGGTGVYASWLAEQGYDVRLVDIVPAHVEAATKLGTFQATVGDARALTEPDGAYDAVLLLGPLYHLQAQEDRLRALHEAGRVAVGGGIVVPAFISRGAVALDGYARGWIDQPGANEILRTQLMNGFSSTEHIGFSGVSYFHSPSEARAEMALAGMEVLALLGIEGPGWVAPDFDRRWANPEGREIILDTARVLESDPALQVLSAHLLGFCRNL